MQYSVFEMRRQDLSKNLVKILQTSQTNVEETSSATFLLAREVLDSTSISVKVSATECH